MTEPGANRAMTTAKSPDFESGVPLIADRDQAWRDFAGWRVNYDTVLLALAAMTMAPYAPWSSDRSLLPTRRKVTKRAK